MSTGGKAPKRQSWTPARRSDSGPFDEEPDVADDVSLSSDQYIGNQLLVANVQLPIANEESLSTDEDDTVVSDNGDPLLSDDEVVYNEFLDGGSNDNSIDEEPDDDTVDEEQLKSDQSFIYNDLTDGGSDDEVSETGDDDDDAPVANEDAVPVPVHNIPAPFASCEASRFDNWPVGWPRPVGRIGRHCIRKWPCFSADVPWRGRAYPSVPRLELSPYCLSLLKGDFDPFWCRTYELGSFDYHWWSLNRRTRPERVKSIFQYVTGNLNLWGILPVPKPVPEPDELTCGSIDI
jgi:hypothetical protein